MDLRLCFKLACVAILFSAESACFPAEIPTPIEAGVADAGRPCDSGADCDDGRHCSGEEHCSEDGFCAAGTEITCDDGIACTDDACVEATQSCEHTPIDADGDGHPPLTCVDAEGAPLGDDCDDGDSLQFPGNPELCNPHDEDCDPDTLGDLDADGDGHVASECCSDFGASDGRCGTDCDDADPAIAQPQPELCDSKDNDCDLRIDEEVACGGP